MSFLVRLIRKFSNPAPSGLTARAREFLAGQGDTLKSIDVDPEGAASLLRFEQAMVLKKPGNLHAAANLLHQSCAPPSIYTGHYRELFKIWRQLNRDDLKEKKFQLVLERAKCMVRLDEEMTQEMLRYWGIQQKKKLPVRHFDGSRNFLQTDAKALFVAAAALGDKQACSLAERLLKAIKQRKDA